MSDKTSPGSIAIIGASRDQKKYGNRAVRAYKDAGWTVFPINPKAKEIEGLTAYPSITALPAGATTLASVYTPPDVTIALLDELRAYGITEVYLNPGAERDDVVTKAREIGINPMLACSVTAIGKNPEEYAPSDGSDSL